MNRDRAALAQILERIELAVEFAGNDRGEFLTSRIRQEAVVRELEVIGEAVKRVSQPTRAGVPGVPWKGMAGFKDVAIHQYDALDLERVWEIVHAELPGIRSQVRNALRRVRDG